MQLQVKKIKQESSQVLTIYLKKPKKFFYYPGQYINLTLPNHQSRSFTLSSSPTEKLISVTVKKGLSAFKRLLENIKIGDQLQTTHPAGTFIFDENLPAVFLTGGIGITPFRSMIKYAVDKKLNTSITLIYSNSDKKFTFKKELDKWQKQLINIRVIYLDSSVNGHLNKNSFKDLIVNSKFPVFNSVYYLAGPVQMVSDFKKMLRQLNVDEVNIRTDAFIGY